MPIVEKVKRDWFSKPQVLEPPMAKTNCVFLHGFGGSPLDIEPLASSLYHLGHRCEAPVIVGQKDMHLGSSFKTFNDIVRETHEQVLSAVRPHLPLILIGFSMGGALSVIHAKRFKPDAIVLLAPYFGLKQGRWLWERFGGALASLLPPVPKLSSGRIACRNGRKRYKAGSDWLSLRSVRELDKVAEAALSSISSLTVPVLWCHSHSDPVADYLLAESVMPPQVEVFSLFRSHHVVLYDHDKEAVIKKCIEFIDQFSQQELC